VLCSGSSSSNDVATRPPIGVPLLSCAASGATARLLAPPRAHVRPLAPPLAPVLRLISSLSRSDLTVAPSPRALALARPPRVAVPRVPLAPRLVAIDLTLVHRSCVCVAHPARALSVVVVVVARIIAPHRARRVRAASPSPSRGAVAVDPSVGARVASRVVERAESRREGAGDAAREAREALACSRARDRSGAGERVDVW
jgi:hypothetical protein